MRASTGGGRVGGSRPSDWSRGSSGGGSGRANAFENMDEILTQRSQASMSDGGRSLRSQRSGHSQMAGLVHGGRVVRRHSAGRVLETSILEYASSDSEEALDNRRTVENSSTVLTSTSSPRNGGFLSCLGGCFNVSPKPRRASLPAGPTVPKNIFCAKVFQTLLFLSEDIEIETDIDKRIVFLLFSALSGEPLLKPAEYADCDEWVDWLTLGYSSDTLDAFERDINRLGSQSLGMFLSLFFALQYTESARLCHLIIRNVHFEPSALFGLFAVNCAKWTRDVVMDALMDFRGDEAPDIFSNQKNSACDVFEWWSSGGARGRIDEAEARFAPNAAEYDAFEDEDLDDPITALPSYGENLVNEPAPDPRFQRLAVLSVREQRQILTAVGMYYSNCVLSFAHFWLEKDLIACNADVARERLNNAYLDKEFVSKLRFSFSADLVKRNHGLETRLHSMWAKSGWKRHDLVKSPASAL